LKKAEHSLKNINSSDQSKTHYNITRKIDLKTHTYVFLSTIKTQTNKQINPSSLRSQIERGQTKRESLTQFFNQQFTYRWQPTAMAVTAEAA